MWQLAAGNAGSNPARGMDVAVGCECPMFPISGLYRRADHPSRVVLLNMCVCVCVCARARAPVSECDREASITRMP